MSRTPAWILALVFFAACTPSSEPTRSPVAPAEPAAEEAAAEEAAAIDRDVLVSRIRRHFESSGQIPGDVNMELLRVEDAEIGELQRGVLRLWKDDQEQELDFLVSADGRWFLRVAPVDLTVDPIAQVIDSITIGPDDPYLGGKDAEVTIVEYSDFQCPFCARAETIVKDDVLREYGDKVRFVYKQMPLVSIHPWAQPASEIGLCVFREGGNDVYWKYHREVFARQSDVEVATATEQLLAIAGEAGGDVAKVTACFEAAETAAIISATLEEAEELSVNSTPTFFINGRRLSGAQPLEAFKAVIDPELGNS
ncbi:MAG: thioredoxin domain-containing protein [Candidatus Binatia bacterium]|nr:thioredoxin domain-containing protein [Candidatus Binatia bacterium]